MKKVVYWLTLFFLLFSYGAVAAPKSANHSKNTRSVSCDLLGQKYSEVLFTVIGTPGKYQEVHVKQGGNIPQVLWYTEGFQEDTKQTEYIFNESSLKDSIKYEVLFVNDIDSGFARYYRRNISAGNQYWQLIEETNTELKNGNLTVIGEGEIANLTCSSSETVPDMPEIELDICSYVPNSTQTNDYFDGVPSGTTSLNITSGGNFIYVPSANPQLSFARVNQSTSNNCNINGKQVDCSVDPQLTFPNFPPELEGYDTSDATIYEDVECSGSCELKPGKYRNLLFLTENATLTLQSGSYYFNELNFNQQNTQIVVKENKAAEVNYKKIDFGTHDIKLNANADAENFLLIGHGTEAGINITNANSVLNGYIYVDPAATNHGGFTLSGSNITITGGVSARSVNIAGGGNHKIGQSNKGECLSNTTDDDYTLVLSPESDIALVCEDIRPTVSVMDSGQLASNFTGTVVVNIDGEEQRFSGTSSSFAIQSGGASKTVLVTAYIDGEQSTSLVSGRYEFVPYKFSAADQYVVANKPQQVEVKALACDDNGGVVDAGYVGSPAIQSSWVSPSSGASGSFTYAPEFTSGTTSSELVLDDAGKMEVSLEDTNFDCSGLTGCPIEGRGALKGSFMIYSRPWTFALCSTNNTDIDTATGTSAAGNAFVAAGEEFDVRVLPIKYQAASSGEVETNSAWCGASNITSNFFVDNAFSNNVKLSSEVASPESHISSVLIASNDGLIQSRVNSDKVYNFTRLYWNDVGSLKVMASTENYSPTCSSPIGLEAWYECTQLGFRNIGRFYPHHFKLDSNSWTAVDGQKDVNYMGQSFALAEVYVSPYAKGANTPVSNYHLFDNSLVAQFAVVDDEEIENRLFLDTELGSWGVSTSTSLWSLNDDSAYVSKLIAPNGPFNTNDVNSVSSTFGLTISGADPVQFYNSDGSDVSVTQTLTQQPPVRFGRIQLDDVGGSQGAKLTVPLRVEYWNGKRFIQNTEDDGTIVNAALEKQELIWSSDGAGCDVTVAVVEDDRTKPEGYDMLPDAQVTQGRLPNALNERLLAYQNCVSPTRQQSEVWLNLQQFGSNIPWLKYDWDNDGEEENPSSVVTFGIYRGNDRVIYRGEPGLTGQ